MNRPRKSAQETEVGEGRRAQARAASVSDRGATGHSAWALGRGLFGADRSAPGACNESGRVKRLIVARLRAKLGR